MAHHRERAQAALRKVWQSRSQRREGNRRMPGHGRGDRRAAAVERHMDQVEPERETELLADEMHRGADASRGVIVTARIRPDELDEFLDAPRRYGRMDPEAKGDVGSQRDRIKIVIGIVGYPLIEARIDDEGIDGHQHGVAVMGAARRLCGADIAAGARQVLYIELLAETLRKPLADVAREHVSRAPYGERNDHAYRSRRIGLRLRNARHGWYRGSPGGKIQECSTWNIHGCALIPRLSPFRVLKKGGDFRVGHTNAERQPASPTTPLAGFIEI